MKRRHVAGWLIVFLFLLALVALLPVITPDPVNNPGFRISIFEWLADKLLFGPELKR